MVTAEVIATLFFLDLVSFAVALDIDEALLWTASILCLA